MRKVAIVGANGQVGAELCLLLARDPRIALVPVCRTRSGSAFLRAQGIAVRHGSVADPRQARDLLGDCDLIVNAALATGTPRQIRAAEDAIIRNVLAAAPPRARVAHFSTQSVYGDPSPGRLIRWRNPYGRAKLGTERTALRAARASGRELCVLRLGHVGGELQGISADIRAALAQGQALLPAADMPSNLVYTVTIVDALQKIDAGDVAPGIYDLMCAPQLGWRQVFEIEAGLAGIEAASIETLATPARRHPLRALLSSAARLVATPAMRDLLAKLLASVPERWNARANAWWYRQRARTEIGALGRRRDPAPHFSWVANGSNFIATLTPTLTLLAARPYADLLRTGRAPWPSDLAPAVADVPLPAGLASVSS